MNFKDIFTRKVPAANSLATSWFKRGDVHASRQQWQPALECYREAARLDPNHAEAHAYLGNVLCQLSDPAAALVAYDQAIAVKPDYAEAHYNRGSLLYRAGQPRAALESYDTALSINPAITEAHCSRGDVLREMGRFQDAMASYALAIAVDGGNSKAYLHRGILQQQLRMPEPAEKSYRLAISLRPAYADAYFNLGILQSDMGKHAEALTSFNDAIAAAPGHAHAYAGRGLALMALDQLQTAVASFDMAVQLLPNFARAIGNRAEALARMGLLADARASHDQAVLADPHDAALYFNRGVFLNDCKDWQGAIQSCREAIALMPDHADAYSQLGFAQQKAGQADDALDSYSRAVAINPALAKVFNNRGNVFRSRKQFDQSLLDYRRTIALEPNSAEGHFNLGQAALLQGDFATGWPAYEWRHRIEEARSFRARELLHPAWFGERPLRGRSIFLHAEQGLGDTLQFCRYAELVAALGAVVFLEVQPALADLLRDLDGVTALTSFGSPVPETDYQCSLMSLPGALKTTLGTIPNKVPYLRADPLKVKNCREFLGAATRPRVGLCWSGNPSNADDINRSISLARLLAHLPDGFEYFCLQNEVRDSDQPTMRASARIRVLDAQLDNFPDTAALIDALDLVITVDTSLAHLSGAMAKKTWLLLPFLPDWRWLLDRNDSPWYPTLRLYRQPVANDWDSALTEVSRELRLWCP